MLRSTCAVLLATLVAAAIVFSNSVVSRYQEYPCQFRHSFAHAEPAGADIVVFGNSRSMRAMDAGQLEAALALSRPSPRVQVLELSRSWRGQEQALSLLRSALSRNEPRLLLLEYNRGPGGTRRYHPHTPLTLPMGDLLSLAWNDSDNGALYVRLAWVAKQVAERTVKRVTELLVGEYRLARELGEVAPRTRDCTPVSEAILLEQNAKRMERSRDWAAHEEQWSFDAGDNVIMDRFTDAIISEARSGGTEVLLYFVPRLGQSPLAAEFPDRVRQRFNARFVAPPPELMAQLYQPGMFRDPTHMTLRGSRLYAEWIAPMVAAELGTARP